MTTLHDELSWRAQVDAAMRADDGWLTLMRRDKLR
jgi:hypothetical protein